MGIDDNFAADNRLRLASFLRVVKSGMPERPSRFRRRMQTTGEHSEALVPNPLVIHDLFTTSAELQEELYAFNHSELDPSKCTSALTEGKSLEFSEILPGEQVPAPEQEAQSDSNDKPLYQLTFALPHSNHPGRHDRPVRARLSVSSLCQDCYLSDVNESAKSTAITSSSKAVIVSGIGRSPDTHKRPLPLNELSLQRTTTAGGLPDSHNVGTIFTTPITEIDPIEEDQRLEGHAISTIKGTKSPCNDFTDRLDLGHRWMRDAHTSRTNDQPNGRTTSPIKVYRMPGQSSNNIRKLRLEFENGCDGFTRSELILDQDFKPRRRGRIVYPGRKKKAVIGGLILTSGLLPRPRPEAPEISNASDIVPYDHAPKNRRRSGESIIRKQLSNVTAPSRSNSSSSESDLGCQEQGQPAHEEHWAPVTTMVGNLACF